MASQQVTGTRLVTEPAGVVGLSEDQRHTVVNFGHEFVSNRRDDRKGANTSPEVWSYQFSQRPPMPDDPLDLRGRVSGQRSHQSQAFLENESALLRVLFGA